MAEPSPSEGKAATPACHAGAPPAKNSSAKGAGSSKAVGKGLPATTPSKGDGDGKASGKGPPAVKPAGGQVNEQELEGAISRVLEKLLPEKLALALAQHPQDPRPVPGPAANSSGWPALPGAASSAAPPAWPCPQQPPLAPQQPPPAQWTPNPLLPEYVPGTAYPRSVMMPAEGAPPGDGVSCPTCKKFIRGGSSALRAHQATSSTCRAMAGDAEFGREPCEFCGKMLAANDHWAKNQHAVYCQGQRQPRPMPSYSGPPPTRWRPQRSDRRQAQQWQQPTGWQQRSWY